MQSVVEFELEQRQERKERDATRMYCIVSATPLTDREGGLGPPLLAAIKQPGRARIGEDIIYMTLYATITGVLLLCSCSIA